MISFAAMICSASNTESVSFTARTGDVPHAARATVCAPMAPRSALWSSKYLAHDRCKSHARVDVRGHEIFDLTNELMKRRRKRM